MKRVLGLIAFLAVFSTGFSDEKPNVLVFLVDDLRNDLGCYGNPVVQSPNIDRLSEQGVTFDKAYCQQAICAPSRMSLLTGLRPDNIGIYSIFTPLRSVHKDLVTLPQFFKENGYQTISIGKVYHHRLDDKESWTIHYPSEPNAYASVENNELLQHLKANGKRVKGPAFECAEVGDIAYKDGRSAQSAVQVLHKLKADDQNFVMFVGFGKPHLPFNAPKKYWDLYDRDALKIPLKKSPEGMSDYALTRWGELRGYHGIPNEGLLDDDLTRELIHGYYACVSYMDAQVGKVMEALEALDMRENTMVILMSDHGWKLGEYGAWCKHTNFELDVRVPLIVSRESAYPKRVSGERSDALVENVDLLPTLADLCGLPLHSVDGKSILELVDKPSLPWDQGAYSLFGRGDKIMGLTVTDGEYRYTEWRNSQDQSVDSAELYRCAHDYSIQAKNLLKQDGFEDVAKRMAALLYEVYPQDREAFINHRKKK